MIIAFVVDDRNGMLFNRRRQSQDRELRKKLLSLAAGSRLWMNAYSYGQFEDAEQAELAERGCEVVVAEDFLEQAQAGELCFVENVSAQAHIDRIEKVILFRWNRVYPGDVYLDLDLQAAPWKRMETEEFAGFSHEKITMEVYCHA